MAAPLHSHEWLCHLRERDASMLHTISFRRRDLPHWYVADRTYFVTFRLKDRCRLPSRTNWRQERERLLTEAANDTRRCLDAERLDLPQA